MWTQMWMKMKTRMRGMQPLILAVSNRKWSSQVVLASEILCAKYEVEKALDEQVQDGITLGFPGL